MPRPDFAPVCAATLQEWKAARRRVVESDARRGAVHAWRIQTRRLLALEALLAPRGAARRRGSLEHELHAAFHASGALRDAQVGAAALGRLARTTPEAARLARYLQRREPQLVRRLQRRLHATHGRQLARIIDGWYTPRRGDPGEVLTGRATRRLRSTGRRVNAMPRTVSGTARSLHRRRIRLKELRYMAELGRAAGMPRLPRLARLITLQTRLGTVTDLDMLLRVLARFAAKHPHWREARVLRRELLDRRSVLVRISSRRGSGAS